MDVLMVVVLPLLPSYTPLTPATTGPSPGPDASPGASPDPGASLREVKPLCI